MPYATQQDMLELEGEDAVYAAADRNGDGTLDEDAIARALDNASGEMNSYIGQRYDLPLAIDPPWAKQTCIDIAIYRLCRGADRLSKPIIKRYEDAQSFLSQVAGGKAGLGLPTTPSTGAGTAGEVIGGEILVASGERMFGRRKRVP